ncbi:Dimethyladenosine transferase 2, mitochondrial [Ophiophagus hannah]|uniref:Dimethyladenosine transferase 2, mitochondrial n=1 Tax=Ophiophagus hannah TaxID=8665 RepID=V8NYH1_OPHHA|nr:Dimethyladenosine transferase 2, mitochondrial [Ophiophagus hannah]
MTFVASVSPLFGGRQLTLAASTLRCSVRGLKGQSVRLGLHNLKNNYSLKGEIAEMVANAERDSTSDRRFLACPLSAHKVASQLTRGRNLETSKTYFLEFEAGPGVLTRKLLNTGAHVIALESNKSFLPNLEVDVPLKVVGIVPPKDERIFIWRYTYFLYECSSVYNYGRIELNLFVSERMYKVFVAKPSDKKFYQTLSVLWQTACDIQLLHKNELLYLVQLTPRKDLFTDFLTTANSKTFIMMVKQCFGKASTKLHNKLNLWTYENARNLLRELEIPEDVTAGSLYPEAYKSLFERMEQSNRIDRSLFCDIDLLADDSSLTSAILYAARVTI